MELFKQTYGISINYKTKQLMNKLLMTLAIGLSFLNLCTGQIPKEAFSLANSLTDLWRIVSEIDKKTNDLFEVSSYPTKILIHQKATL